jgi:hypothetical protein
MKQRPIIQTADQVRAILDGRRTQFRVPIKFPLYSLNDGYKRRVYTESDIPLVSELLKARQKPYNLRMCPFGQIGDKLYVKEEHYINPSDGAIAYRADGEMPHHMVDDRWLCATRMSRYASRLTLEITRLRVERLRQVTHTDISAEGTIPLVGNYMGSYREEWDKNHRKGQKWSDNPWVWVVDFKIAEVRK